MARADNSKPEQVLQHGWPTADRLIARLTVRIDEVASRNGLILHTWTEDGLGPATGCGFRLPSGVIILLVELEALISLSKAYGPDIFCDAGDLHEFGIESLLSETLLTLGLNDTDVEFQFTPPTELEVRNIGRVVDESG